MADLPDNSQVSEALRAAQAGDRDAVARLLSLVYDQLHQLARAQMARLPPGQTLQTTALVHEAYLRLVGKADLQLEGRKHFFFAAGRAMRDILVERARSKAGPKRGGGRRRVVLDEARFSERLPFRSRLEPTQTGGTPNGDTCSPVRAW
jgi:RNA polymerase sigma factor (TIGR02999 family)